MSGIPGLSSPKWYEWEALDAIFAVPSIVAGVIAAFTSFSDQNKSYILGTVLLISAALLLIGGVVKFLRGRAKDAATAQQKSPADLSGCAIIVHTNLRRILEEKHNVNANDRWALRLTLYRLVPGGTELEQCIPYVGGIGGGTGRIFHISTGIIGFVARQGDPHFANRTTDDQEKFVRDAIREWGYTEKQARDIRSDRQSWAAVPIKSKNGQVIGVVYADSSINGFFDEAAPDAWSALLWGCKGIANYIEERYSQK